MNIESERKHSRYPYCVVWTPIPVLTWFFPFIGHTGITTSDGVIRDFAGSYYVAEDDMAFGNPTKIWQLNVDYVPDGTHGWDYGVLESSLDYGGRMHNLIADNCHSHVARALNEMKYDNRTNWNMFKIAFKLFLHGKYVSKKAFLQTWFPFWSITLVLMFTAIFTRMYD